MIVSLERAYHIFLAHDDPDQSDKLTKHEYIVYANFMRFGCHIRRFKNECPISTSSDDDDESDIIESNASDADVQKSYIWNYLYELLGHRKTAITSGRIDQNRYSRVKESMNTTIGKFKDDDLIEVSPCTSANETSEQVTSTASITIPEKRKQNSDDDSTVPAYKMVKLNDKQATNGQYFGSGSTNDFMVGSTFQRFKQIFDKIDIIDVKRPNTFDEQHQPINEKFSFDLWAELDNRHWPKHKGPDFRLIVK